MFPVAPAASDRFYDASVDTTWVYDGTEWTKDTAAFDEAMEDFRLSERAERR